MELEAWLNDKNNQDQNSATKTQFLKTGQEGAPSKLIAVGISNPTLRNYANLFYKEHKDDDFETIFNRIEHLWLHHGSSESIVLAYCILGKFGKKLQYHHFTRFNEIWINEIDQWIAADHLCIDVLGHLPLIEPEYLAEIKTWMTSTNFWRRRLSLTAFVKHVRKDRRYVDVVLAHVDQLKNDKSYYVRKALSWQLRECGNKDAAKLFGYLTNNYHFFKKTELREAVKKLKDIQQDEIIMLYENYKQS